MRWTGNKNKPHGIGAYNRGCRCSRCRKAKRDLNRRCRAKLLAEVASGIVTPPHGTVKGYDDYGCRCDRCRNVYRQYRSDNLRKKYAAFAAGEVKRPHGSITTYQEYGCRCQPCRDAVNAKNQEIIQRRRQKRIGKKRIGQTFVCAKCEYSYGHGPNCTLAKEAS